MPSVRREDPAIAVVVAMRNRSHLLPRLMQALADQRSAPPSEVIVVDDGSADETPAVLERLTRDQSWSVRALRLARSEGPAAARNVGWRAALAPLIAFTDDDCIPQPDWLGALAEELDHADLAQGRTQPNRTRRWSGPSLGRRNIGGETGFYETCNIGCRRNVLESVGGFDERFGPPKPASRASRYVTQVWGEDTNLALRAKAAGARSSSSNAPWSGTS